MSADIIEIKVPALGESVVEATVARWLKNPGELVQTDEIIVELETDKVTLEVSAPASGLLESVAAPQGGTVQAGGILGLIRPGQVAATPTVQNTQPQPIIRLEPKDEVPLEKTSHTLAPSVKKMVDENSIAVETIQGNGKDGRITKGDVIAHIEKPTAFETNTAERLEKRIPLSRLRQRIAQRLKEAQNTAAILTTFNEVDMSTVLSLRAQYKDKFEKKHGIKLGFMSFFVKACVHALQKIPQVNSRIEGEEIISCNYYDIGVAVSAPQGLVVPVVRDADLKTYADIEKEITAYGQKAKDNKLTIEEMSGGTFTISNGGTFGSLLSTPILNPPQSGILGMHKIQERPVVVNGRIEIRSMMYLAMSYDHRLVDGREAVTFLVTIKDMLENPGQLLLDL